MQLLELLAWQSTGRTVRPLGSDAMASMSSNTHVAQPLARSACMARRCTSSAGSVGLSEPPPGASSLALAWSIASIGPRASPTVPYGAGASRCHDTRTETVRVWLPAGGGGAAGLPLYTEFT